MFLLVAMLTLFAAEAQPAPAPTLQQVTAELSEGAVVLTFATSAASVPGPVKALESPIRLYFDVPGFRPGDRHSWDVNLGPVRQVRTALNQPRPPVMRVVVELAARATWRVEPGRSPREFRLVVTPGEADAAATPALSGEPAKPAEPAEPAERAEPQVPEDSARAQIREALNALGPVLESIRAGDGPSDAALTVMLSRAESLAGAARALGAGTGDDALLRIAADAVLSASRARAAAVASGDAQSRANAVSAAAGALLLIDRLR